MQKVTITSFIVILLSFYATTSLASYSSEQAESTKESKESSTPIERIEVIGRKPLRFYKNQVRKAELDYIKEFNALVKESEFQIHCYMVAVRPASKIKRRACAPRYEDNEKTRFATNAFDLLGIQQNAGYLKRVSDKSEKHKQITKELVEKHPELRDKFLKMHNAKDVLDKVREEKFARN